MNLQMPSPVSTTRRRGANPRSTSKIQITKYRQFEKTRVSSLIETSVPVSARKVGPVRYRNFREKFCGFSSHKTRKGFGKFL